MMSRRCNARKIVATRSGVHQIARQSSQEYGWTRTLALRAGFGAVPDHPGARFPETGSPDMRQGPRKLRLLTDDHSAGGAGRGADGKWQCQPQPESQRAGPGFGGAGGTRSPYRSGCRAAGPGQRGSSGALHLPARCQGLFRHRRWAATATSVRSVMMTGRTFQDLSGYAVAARCRFHRGFALRRRSRAVKLRPRRRCGENCGHRK